MSDKFLKTLPVILFLIIPFYPILTYFLLPTPHFLFLLTPFLIYYILKTIYFTYGLIAGYRKYGQEKDIDWFEKVKELNLPTPEHLIVIPVYKEDISIIARTLDSIISQNYGLNKFHISITIEDRPDFGRLKDLLIKKYSNAFNNKFEIYRHILNGDEVKGAASNRTFGSRAYIDKLILQAANIDNFLITSPDADTVFDPNYFARVSYAWLTDERKSNCFYQTAVYKFSNNYDNVPILVRALSAGLSLSILSTSTFDESNRYTFSCFSLSLKTMIEVDYWDSTIAVDDTPFHFRAFDKLKGDWRCKVFYIPLSVDAINSPNYFQTHKKQYQQYYRWGWGIIAFPLAIKSILNLETNIYSKFYKLWKVFDVFILVRIFPIIVLSYLSLISLMQFKDEFLAIISVLKNLNIIVLVFIFSYQFQLVSEDSKMKHTRLIASTIMEVILGIINLITFCMIPYIHAALEMALGKNPDKKIKWSIKFISNT